MEQLSTKHLSARLRRLRLLYNVHINPVPIVTNNKIRYKCVIHKETCNGTKSKWLRDDTLENNYKVFSNWEDAAQAGIYDYSL